MLRLVLFVSVMASIVTGVVASGSSNSAAQRIFGTQSDIAEVKTFDKPALTDLLTIEPAVSVFYDYVRQSENIVSFALLVAIGRNCCLHLTGDHYLLSQMKRLSTNTPTTIFAPRDAAILSLHRKPHQGPAASPGDFNTMTEEEQDREMLAYLEKWTEGYIVGGADFVLEDGTELPTLAGGESRLAFEVSDGDGEHDWQRVTIQPGGARILAAREVSLRLEVQICVSSKADLLAPLHDAG